MSESIKNVVLITGAATGIGNLTARALAAAGHTVYASMRDIAGRNAEHANELIELGRREGQDLRVVELDVTSQESADAAVATILGEAGRLDALVHNAGHLFVGYVEAFTAENVTHLFDVNTVGVHRVNRAVLPHMRERRSGTLVYVGSTTSVVVPPFLGPYVASKTGADAFAQVTAYEATEGLFPPGVDAHPHAVAEEITRVLALPAGSRPFRTVVDFGQAGVENANTVLRQAQEEFITRLGFGELLNVTTQD